MGDTILFCFVFLSQILLISWFYARRVVGRGRYVLQTVPPSTHPKLYPQPIEYYERRLRNYARLNFAIVVVGLLIIVGLILGALGGEWDGKIGTPWSASGEWDAAIVTPFFLLQMFASVYLDLAGLKHQKAMAKAPRMSLSSRSFCISGVSNSLGSRLPAISPPSRSCSSCVLRSSAALCTLPGPILTKRTKTVATGSGWW